MKKRSEKCQNNVNDLNWSGHYVQVLVGVGILLWATSLVPSLLKPCTYPEPFLISSRPAFPRPFPVSSKRCLWVPVYFVWSVSRATAPELAAVYHGRERKRDGIQCFKKRSKKSPFILIKLIIPWNLFWK